MVITIILLALTAATLPVRADEQSQSVPASVAALLPATAKLADGDWGVFDTEFGKTFTAGMRATLPGRRMSCDSTVGPELRAELKGDTASISEIFDWFAGDFGGDVKTFINKYRDQPLGASVKIEFQKYDWSRNDAK